MANAYAAHLDEDELPLDTRIELAREKERRLSKSADTAGGGHVDRDDAGPEESRATEQAGDDPDLHVVSADAEKRGCLFIHPGRAFSMTWGFFTVLVVLWVVLSLPFKLAFLSER